MFAVARSSLKLASLLALASACGEAPSSEPSGDREDRILAEYLAEHQELVENHGHWHSENLRADEGYGEYFLQFHRRILGEYESWRERHGYGPLAPWSPNDPVPASSPHPGRLSENPSLTDPLCRVPSWFSLEGSTARDPDFGASRLDEFLTAEQLGRAIDSQSQPTWHTRVHATIGGDLANPRRVVVDPVFWSFHKFIDGLWSEWLEATGQLDPGPATKTP